MFEVRHRSSRIILQLVLALLTIPFLLPLVEMVRGAFAGRGFHNFVVVWQTGVIPTFFKNSILVSLGVIALVYAGSMTAAFGFAKLRVPGKELFFWMMLVALTLPEVVLLSPLFVTFIKLQLYNTLFAVILPLAALQLPFAILLARNYVAGVPSDLIDASRIDGANLVQVFRYVIMPLSKPIAAAIVVLSLIGSWNSYLLPLDLPARPLASGGDAAAAVLHRRVRQRPDEDPRRRRHGRHPDDPRLRTRAEAVRARSVRRRTQVRSHLPCPWFKSTYVATSSRRRERRSHRRSTPA